MENIERWNDQGVYGVYGRESLAENGMEDRFDGLEYGEVRYLIFMVGSLLVV